MSSLSILAASPWLAILFAAVLGLVVGSFLNVVIVRLPRMMEHAWQAECAELQGVQAEPGPAYNLAQPASHCPHCGHPVAWYQNIPVLSWLALRGRCAHCSAPISWQYPLVEAGTALLFVACYAALGATPAALAAMAFCAACVALAVIDARTSLLPDDITLPLLWGGLLANLWGLFVPLQDAVIGAMAGYVALWLVYWCFRLATGKEGMGYGDFKLLAAIGAWLGWQILPMVAVLASLAGVAGAVVLMLLGRAQRGQALPFGPYLAAAGVIAILAGDAWTRFFLGR
jgi:leader peptidase (prepilin peptidase)/N-methyltransferase